MRTLIILPMTLLSACGSGGPDAAVREEDAAARQRAGAEGRLIKCSGGEADAANGGCLVELARDADGRLVTVRHPDGSFRRFRITNDGRGVATADGAENAAVAVLGPNRIAVTVAGERYELPATIKGTPARP